MWESHSNSNRGGNSIWTAVIELPDVALLITPDFGTRFDPFTGQPSTIDLTFSSPTISLSDALKLVPLLGSDDPTVLMSFDESATPTSGRPLRWIFREDKWDEWNVQIAARLRKSNRQLHNTVTCLLRVLRYPH